MSVITRACRHTLMPTCIHLCKRACTCNCGWSADVRMWARACFASVFNMCLDQCTVLGYVVRAFNCMACNSSPRTLLIRALLELRARASRLIFVRARLLADAWAVQACAGCWHACNELRCAVVRRIASGSQCSHAVTSSDYDRGRRCLPGGDANSTG